MAIKVTDAVGGSDKTSSTIDLGDVLDSLPASARKQVKRDVGDYLIESILTSASKLTSPVDGEEWKKTLNKKYADHKKSEGLTPKPDMSFEGDYLDALKFKDAGDNKIEIGWFGSQAAKADGHNNISGASKMQRRLIPDAGQSFKDGIQSEIEQIVEDAINDNVDLKKSDFDDVKTKSQLYAALKEYFPEMSRAEIALTVSRSQDLAQFLDELDLFELL